jgi:ABC-type polysaccharide/polyol phosphate transport system ATPase subunit
MSPPIIRVENLSKRYRIRHQQPERYTALRDVIAANARSLLRRVNPLARRPVRGMPPDQEDFWALKDVSFEVNQGDRIGIIGRNGAGKSTLLKILSRITEPTAGTVRLRGRVASLLEVGTGFHPELTGRENIFLNGAILGMSKAEIRRKFDEIVAFAEVEKFLDIPVKRYSSGMYVRLAFAVAAHLEPEILLVDEVLAVGDAQFQKKCLGKMEDVATNEGRTILFVSHNMQAISTLTQRCIVLSKGDTTFQGTTEQAIQEYLKDFRNNEYIYLDRPSKIDPKITKVVVETSEVNNVHIHGNPLRIKFEISTPHRIRGACLSFQIFNTFQQPIIHSWTFDSERPMCRSEGIYEVICEIPYLHLYMGNYTLTVHFSEPPGGRKFQTLEGICPFEVVMYGISREFKWQPNTCIYLEPCHWNIKDLTLINR